jgi:uncharacterized protein YjdB
VTVSPKTNNLAQNVTRQLTATVLPEDADDKTVTWESSDETVATVDSNGLVTAQPKQGQAIITVKTVNGLTDTATVNVSDQTGA